MCVYVCVCESSLGVLLFHNFDLMIIIIEWSCQSDTQLLLQFMKKSRNFGFFEVIDDNTSIVYDHDIYLMEDYIAKVGDTVSFFILSNDKQKFLVTHVKECIWPIVCFELKFSRQNHSLIFFGIFKQKIIGLAIFVGFL